jgi:predicted Ser/Thr protein kinase
MTSLAHTFYRFHNGGLTQEQLIAQVDRMLATDRLNSTQLKEILNEELTRTLLTPDVYDALQTRAVEEPPATDRGTTANTTGSTTSSTLSIPELPTTPSDQAEGGENRMKGVGDTLNGRFVLEECIGFGGMGTVYKALDLRKLEASDRKPYIAIKVLNVQFRGHPKSLIALQREAKKAQTLAHQNIVAVYDFDRDGSTVYLTMEYLSGKPLSQLLRNPDFTGMGYEEAMHIVTGMARALAYAHERGFVHCDFKPANVILTDRAEVKVIDFGIARAIHKPTEETEATVFDPGSLGGLTPAYASAEMLERREPDPRDDIYALACITYELLTGRHPFDRQTAAQARNADLKPQRPKSIGNAQWRALRQALAFKREQRTPSVQRFLQDMGVVRSHGRPFAIAAVATVSAALLSAGAAFWWASSMRDKAPGSDMDAAPGTASVQTAPSPASGSTPAPASTLAPANLSSVNRWLAQIPCAALWPSMDGEVLRVEGFLPGSYGIGRLRGTLAAAGARKLSLNVQEIADDKCALVNMLAPYWKQNRQRGGRASVQTKPRDAKLVEGDKLVLDVATPGYDSFVNVDYFSFDGGVVHLLPSPRLRANQAPPNYSATLGSFGNWIVSKPFGTDMVVLLVTPAPLFDAMRPEAEKGGDYLAAVDKRLRQLAGKHGADKIVVDFLQVTTSARSGKSG